jgi:secondary thiamine-phosphate synthase enzyme
MRAAPPEPAPLLVHRKRFVFQSSGRRQALDVRREVEEAIGDAGVRDGLVLVSCLHTTCSVLVMEAEPARIEDFVRSMGAFIDEGKAFRHNDLRWSDCERGNATAHLRASLLGHGLTIGIIDGALALDESRTILLAEWDGPRARTVDVHVLGA